MMQFHPVLLNISHLTHNMINSFHCFLMGLSFYVLT